MKMLRDMTQAQLRALLSLTKYPSIETFHALGERGRLTEAHELPPEEVIVTEKVDGTNAAIVLWGDEFLIRSREEWLTYSSDVIRNPALHIVEALLPMADNLVRFIGDPETLQVLYGEVYGRNINAAKTYTSTDALGFRLFDVLNMVEAEVDELLERPIEQIAGWRDHGGQRFASEEVLQATAAATELPLVPRIDIWTPFRFPESLSEMHLRMEATARETRCTLDPVYMPQRPEGIVLRTSDRRWIRKARFEDYRRALHGQGRMSHTGNP